MKINIEELKGINTFLLTEIDKLNKLIRKYKEEYDLNEHLIIKTCPHDFNDYKCTKCNYEK
tara:strand:- start:1390 stop:1572 length:183 start_codon:yes stop_codon:yes gene_type:complete